MEMSRSPGTMIGSGPIFTFCTFMIASDGAERNYVINKIKLEIINHEKKWSGKSDIRTKVSK